jgi:hypothetical protein
MSTQKEDPEHIHKRHDYRWKKVKVDHGCIIKEEKPTKGQPLEKHIT